MNGNDVLEREGECLCDLNGIDEWVWCKTCAFMISPMALLGLRTFFFLVTCAYLGVEC